MEEFQLAKRLSIDLKSLQTQQMELKSANSQRIILEKQNFIQNEDQILQDLEEDFIQIAQTKRVMESAKKNIEEVQNLIFNNLNNEEDEIEKSERYYCQLGPQKYLKQKNSIISEMFNNELTEKKNLKQQKIQSSKNIKQTVSNEIINSVNQQDYKTNKEMPFNQLSTQTQIKQDIIQQMKQNDISSNIKINSQRQSNVKPLQDIKPVSVLPIQPRSNKVLSLNQISHCMNESENQNPQTYRHQYSNLKYYRLFQEVDDKLKQIKQEKVQTPNFEESQQRALTDR